MTIDPQKISTFATTQSESANNITADNQPNKSQPANLLLNNNSDIRPNKNRTGRIDEAPKKQVKSVVSGVVLIDKPQGLTSQQVVSKVKYLFKSPQHNSKKAGHTGTLDPMATGLLPVCLGEATKYSHYQLDADKSYHAIIKLGVQTDTGDAEGSKVATKPVPSLNQDLLDSIAKRFCGPIQQTPPMYSALKKEGKKLYEYARAGIEVERKARPITIKSIELMLGQDDDEVVLDEVMLNVTCSKGTYVRVLGEDIAKALGTLGHLISLRRTQVGHFNISCAISLKDLEALAFYQRFEKLLGIDACITTLPILTVSESQHQRLHLGQRLNVKNQLNTPITNYLHHNANDDNPCDIRLYNENGSFIGLAKLEVNGRLQPKKMVQR